VQRRLAWVAATFLTVGCGGGTSDAEWARAQTVALGWTERCGSVTRAVTLGLRRLTLSRDRWRVEASVQNGTGVALSVLRPHTDETFFGLAAFQGAGAADVHARARRQALHLQLVADRFRPQLPRLLAPGAGWSGTFSGPGRLPRGRFIRVVVGRFVIRGTPPRGLYREFLCVSRPSRRLT